MQRALNIDLDTGGRLAVGSGELTVLGRTGAKVLVEWSLPGKATTRKFISSHAGMDLIASIARVTLERKSGKRCRLRVVADEQILIRRLPTIESRAGVRTLEELKGGQHSVQHERSRHRQEVVCEGHARTDGEFLLRLPDDGG